MGGGGGGKQQYVPPAQMKPVPQFEFPTGQWGGVGPTPVENPFTQQGMPLWMRPDASGQPGYVQGQPNWFGMPSWGMSAADPTRALTQEDLMYQPPPPPPPQAAPASEPEMPIARRMSQPGKGLQRTQEKLRDKEWEMAMGGEMN